MVKIRMTRTGRKKLPAYRVVVADSRSARDGRSIEQIGWYQPLNKGQKFDVDADRALHWLKQGAKPSDTAKSLLQKAGVMKAYHDYRCELAAQRKARKGGAQPATEAATETVAATEPETVVEPGAEENVTADEFEAEEAPAPADDAETE